jgi:hypothetical protein
LDRPPPSGSSSESSPIISCRLSDADGCRDGCANVAVGESPTSSSRSTSSTGDPLATICSWWKKRWMAAPASGSAIVRACCWSTPLPPPTLSSDESPSDADGGVAVLYIGL